MRITILPADLYSQRDLIVETLLRYLTDRSDQRRFDWLYTASPHGLAKVWLAIDGDHQTVIGAAAAFPRRFYLSDSEVLAWVLGDFCLDAQYRSLGPALKLQRACLEVTESNGGIFCYDFPSASMVAVYNRLGIAVTGKMLRLAKLLRVDRKVREVISFPVAARPAAAVGNSLLKLMPTIVADKSLEMALHQGACGEEFSVLARKQANRLGICLKRSAEYLNWRYADNPLVRHEFITARWRGKLNGYAVWTQAGENASVVDMFGENDPVIVKGLLSEVITRLTKSGVMTLSVWLNESHPWLPWCLKMGFRVRDSVPMVCIPTRFITKTGDLANRGWFLMQGDRDS
jgi:hypothetical protein